MPMLAITMSMKCCSNHYVIVLIKRISDVQGAETSAIVVHVGRPKGSNLQGEFPQLRRFLNSMLTPPLRNLSVLVRKAGVDSPADLLKDPQAIVTIFLCILLTSSNFSPTDPEQRDSEKPSPKNKNREETQNLKSW